MASIASPSSPNSLQLRFGHRSIIRPSSIFFKLRFRPSSRRIRFVCANNGGESQSWTNNNRSQDPFAGWFGSDDGEGGDPKKSKDRFGGMLGAGLAGVLFTAGVTFASLSLSGRSTSGVKHQMEPLTEEQEEVLTSEDQIARVDEVRNEEDVMLPDKESKIHDSNLEFPTGIYKDFLPNIEINEDSTGSGHDNIRHSETSLKDNIKHHDNVADVILDAYNQDDMQIAPDVDNVSAPSASSTSALEFSAYNDVGLSPDHFSSNAPEPAIEHDPNENTTRHVELISLGNDSTTHIIDHQEENSTHADIPLDVSSEFEGQLQSKPSTPSLIILEPVSIVNSPDSLETVDIATLVSKEKDLENSDALQLPSESSNLSPAVHDMYNPIPSSTIIELDLDQNKELVIPNESINPNIAQSVPYPVEVRADSYGNEPDISISSPTGRSSTFETALPEKTISYAGIPAPSLVSAALQVPPGKVLVPAVVDQVQGQALAALQVLKVIETDVQPGDLCTRREYARWLVSASSTLSRSAISKVYPAMFIENVTELAFDDVTPEDPDYRCIQGLAEAGIISSKLSISDLNGTSSVHQGSFFFCPESPVSRQDLVSWKMALERRELPEVDRKYLYQCSGYIDVDKIDKDAWPALVADLSTGEQSITALAFGYTRLFRPNKPVTKAQAAIALATGEAAEVVGEELTRIEAESLAESAVNAHTALVAQVEKELNASFESELAKEREKTNSLEKLAEEARLELERLKAEGEEQSNALINGRAAIESEMEVLSKLRHEVEEQLQDLISNKVEISFERDRINKLRKETESENHKIVQLQYELEVERKALSMARAWAEEEAKRAREHAKALEEARDRWERHGIKVVVDEDLQEDAATGVTWLTAGQQQPQIDETVSRAENLVEKLKAMAAGMKIKSSASIDRVIQKINSFISILKDLAAKTSTRAVEIQKRVVLKASRSIEQLKENTSGFGSSVGDKARRAVEDCKDGVEKFTQKFKA